MTFSKYNNCKSHTLIDSTPESFKSKKAWDIECQVYTCKPHPATDISKIFAAMISVIQ